MRSLGVAFTAVAAVLLAGCTVSDAVDGIKSGCKFKANQQDVAMLIVKVGGAINPVFGVAANTVDGVVNLVCASVTAKAKSTKESSIRGVFVKTGKGSKVYVRGRVG